MVSFSKGLGCPVGAALAGSKAMMERGWFVRKRFGGGMRQSGVLAAAAVYALDHHLARLAEDHARAKAFAKRVDGAGGAKVVPPDTNIVMLDLPAKLDANVIVRAAGERGVRLTPWSKTRIRAVVHLDIDDAAIERLGGYSPNYSRRESCVAPQTPVRRTPNTVSTESCVVLTVRRASQPNLRES